MKEGGDLKTMGSPGHITVIWGNPHNPDQRVCARRPCHGDDVIEDDSYGEVDIGPARIDGPLLLPLTPDEGDGSYYIQASDTIPEWVTEEYLRDWGWRIQPSLPAFTSTAVLYDVLLLSPNWTGNFDGWSSTLWMRQTPVVLQRITVPINHMPLIPLHVRVLETGIDPAHGIPTAVMYAPDREELTNAKLENWGWRREPWVKLRRSVWADLVMTTEAWEANVQYLLHQPIVQNIIEHQVGRQLPSHVRNVLPHELQIAFEELSEGY